MTTQYSLAELMQLSHAELTALRDAEDRAAAMVGHAGKGIHEGATDQYVCLGCGWKGPVRYDGLFKARAGWLEHITEHGAVIEYPKPHLRT